ncbi:High affinity cationic amino acid transporter 1 [Araneus ventricosus]|uniref:High affinity cationic amino acid transporter 1 n=1 Tax=Araneus ventricosus TaxID=182803 RepID=A0A4Y2H534_ARAVE|nr:High affinity cationic amino acid transporter 1 [Araneus ventricosus]
MSLNSMYKAFTRRKFIPDENLTKTELDRCLSTFDLTFLGVGSTLGLGIYILVGQIASSTSGPAVALSYFIAAVASVFAALCYAEFGARVPKTGSAYVYSYVTVGEFMAFVIGWNLVLEYVIGTASVARGYSNYLDSIINETIARHLNETLPIHFPSLSSYPDFLAFGITLLLTVILSLGVRGSSVFNNVCTILNLLVVTYAVIVGLFKVNIHNWKLTPEELPSSKFGTGGFFPYGFRGVMSGAATCFYGYVGFDCIATTGEEARNPQRAIPIAIIGSLMIVFTAYFSISCIQTLMWPYYAQDVAAPLPYVFQMVGYPVAKWVITIGALTGLSTSLLGGMFPLPRILYAMAHDGLIFKFLAKTHPKYKTPMLATYISGIFTGFMAMIFDVKTLANMMSIGTLLAYTLVAISVLILRYRVDEEVIPMSPLLVNNEKLSSTTTEYDELESESMDASTSTLPDNPYYIRKMAKKNMSAITSSTNTMLQSTQHYSYRDIFEQIFNRENIEVQTRLSSRVSMWIITAICGFLIVLDILLTVLEDDLYDLDPGAWFSVGIIFLFVIIFTTALARQPSDNKKLSFKVPWVPFIPILSVFVNANLMLKLSSDTWNRFLYWMIAGFLIYFGYGMWNSSERKLPAGKLPTVLEAASDVESEEEVRKSEQAPLLSQKNLSTVD